MWTTLEKNQLSLNQILLQNFEEATLLFSDEQESISEFTTNAMGAYIPFEYNRSTGFFGVISERELFVKAAESMLGISDDKITDDTAQNMCNEIANILIGIVLEKIFGDDDMPTFELPVVIPKDELGDYLSDNFYELNILAEDLPLIFFIRESNE